jgi:hypothetical protein
MGEEERKEMTNVNVLLERLRRAVKDTPPEVLSPAALRKEKHLAKYHEMQRDMEIVEIEPLEKGDFLFIIRRWNNLSPDHHAKEGVGYMDEERLSERYAEFTVGNLTIAWHEMGFAFILPSKSFRFYRNILPSCLPVDPENCYAVLLQRCRAVGNGKIILKRHRELVLQACKDLIGVLTAVPEIETIDTIYDYDC